MEVDDATLARMIERGEVDEDNIVFNVRQELEIPDDCTDIDAYLKNAQIVTDRLIKLKQAHLRFACLSKVSYQSGMDFERHYRELYDDIQAHWDVWFGKIFNVDNKDPTRAE